MGNMVAKVQVETTSELSKITDGLKKGDGLAPLLGNLVMEYVMRKVTVGINAALQYKTIQTVECGDKFIAGKMVETTKQTYELKRGAKEAGLSFNVNKK